MAQNTSMAVMQQRIEPADSLDDFPTPPWATRALCEWLLLMTSGAIKTPGLASMSCREPSANRGHMVMPLGEYFSTVEAADVYDYGVGFMVQDYLFGPLPDPVDWTISNPPFRLAEEFILRALATSKIGCAFLVRTSFLETVGRYSRLFSQRPPSHVLQFSERVVMHKGRLAPKGSTATSYCWLVWINGASGSSMGWIPPCRKKLERPSDYEGEEA